MEAAGTEELNWTFSNRGEFLIVHVQGDIQLFNVSSIAGAVEEQMKVSNRMRVAMDMSCVIRIDSSGIGMLAKVQRAARAAGGELRLVSVNREILNLFRLMRIDSIFSFCHSLEELV